MSLNLIRAVSIALLIAAPTTAMAQSGSRQHQDRDQQQRSQREAQPQRQQAAPRKSDRGQAQSTRNSYGTWNHSWGTRPSAPPKHWSKTGDWYRHVRACQQRYRSYNARTDTFRTNSGHTRRCTL
jgi:hypothetical protein